MAFARPKSETKIVPFIHRYTELSDVIRAQNKREDRLLNVQLKFFEREKNVRLNFLRREQKRAERAQAILEKEVQRIQLKQRKESIPSEIFDQDDFDILPMMITQWQIEPESLLPRRRQSAP